MKEDKSYVVSQTFRGVATYLVTAATGAEAMAKVNNDLRSGDVECVDRDTIRIYKAVSARLDRPRQRRR